MNQISTLEPAEIHVWLAYDRAPIDERALERMRSLLEPDELERLERRGSPEARRRHLIARALRRVVLSRYAPGIFPGAWRFDAGEHGKPALAPPYNRLELYFNLAHTEGLVALAVSHLPDVGIDAENLYERTTALRLAHRYFTAEEARNLAAQPLAEQPNRFYALWTLKEAWMKASGLGLSAGLDNSAFSLDPEHKLVGFMLNTQDTNDWRFWQYTPTTEHAVALALHAPGVVRDMTVTLHAWNPRDLIDAA